MAGMTRTEATVGKYRQSVITGIYQHCNDYNNNIVMAETEGLTKECS